MAYSKYNSRYQKGNYLKFDNAPHIVNINKYLI